MLETIRMYWEAVCRVLAWIPVIWRDRDFDYVFLYKILRYKLSRMEKACSIAVDDHTAKELWLAQALLKRLEKDNYTELEERDHERRWGMLDIKFTETCNPHVNLGEFYYSKATTPEENERANKEASEIGRRADARRENDLDYLFKLMRECVQRWWI